MRDRSHTARMLSFSLVRHISGTQSFQENRLFNFHAFVALKLLVSLIGRLVACTARINVDRQTDRPSTVTLAAHARRGFGPDSTRFDILNTRDGLDFLTKAPASLDLVKNNV